MVRRIRILSQTGFFVLFLTSFFILNNQKRGYRFESEWFLWLNPLVGLLTSVASRRVVMPAVGLGMVILVATAVFGRFFCGMVCPLGALIDFCDKYL